MPRTIVGGRPFDHDQESIERAMRDVEPEPLREHLVEVAGTAFPPKQVVAQVTAWARQSFTTMEAQRALSRAGLACRRVGAADRVIGDDATDSDRIDALENAVAVLTEAVASLRTRLTRVEQRDTTASDV